jgi:uncharacterized protein YejL (UPF0352 family)
MIAELEQIIQAEEAKPVAERDVDLIDDCIHEIAELKGVRSEYSDKEIDRITDKLVKAAEKEKKRKRFIRLAAGIAAAFVIVTGVTACAVNPALINWLAKVVRIPFGDTINSEAITYTNQGITQEYWNIKDFLKAEELDIYYPSILPDNVHLVSIDRFMNSGQNYYVFLYSSPNMCFTVETVLSEHELSGELVTEIECNDLHFDVYKAFYQDGDIHFAICELDDIRYILQCDNIQDIILIVGGLRKGY